MKVLKRFGAIFFIVCIFVTMLVPATALAAEENSHGRITSFSYTVYDVNGNIIETGTMPDPNLRYTWSGVTLDNGQMVEFKKNGNEGFYISEGTRLTYTCYLNRQATMRYELYKGPARIGTNWSRWYSGDHTSTSVGISKIADGDFFFYPAVMCISSDPVTITSVELVF